MGNKVVIANINLKTQIVISCYIHETSKVAEKLSKIEGLSIRQLNVSGAFHSPLMIETQKIMVEEIDKVEFKEPKCEIVPNVLGYGTKDINTIKESLKRQITGTVNWLNTILYMKSMGIKQLYEVGPGDVLRKLNKTITFRLRCDGL